MLKNTVIKLYLKQFTAILINVSAYGREPLAVPFGPQAVNTHTHTVLHTHTKYVLLTNRSENVLDIISIEAKCTSIVL